MQIIYLNKKQINLREFVQRRADESDCRELLKDEFKLVDKSTNRVVALYCKPDEANGFKSLFDACLNTKYQETYRTSGLKTTSRIFGYNPRNAIRKDFCSIASFANEQPETHKTILSGGALAAKYYAVHNEELYLDHLATTTDKIVDDFRLPDVPFTSGIINDNNPLCYHFDSGNFKDVWSAMIVLKKDISGGYLSMPEYGISCEVANNSIFYFDGQSILHGVTPIKKLTPTSRRFSIVYYSLKAMWNCQPLRDEIARARIKREQIEMRRRSGNPVPNTKKSKK
jgi:hypothetical protein